MTSTVTANHICEPQPRADARRAVSVRISSPFRPEDLEAAWPLLEQLLYQQTEDFAPRDAATFLALSKHFDEHGGRTWLVNLNDIPAGWIALTPINEISMGLHVLLASVPEAADANREAIELALTEIFAEFPAIQHVSTTAFVEDEFNFPLLISLCELGAQHEGRLRNQTLRNGAPVDVCVLGILRQEFVIATRGPRAH